MDLKSTPKKYKYLDGSGNEYIINSEFIEYIPVKPSFSSSGVYDGGEYIKKELTKLQYDQFIRTLNLVIRNKTYHIKNRVKMSGMIIIEEKIKKETYILSPGSKEIHKIENLLQEIIT